MFMRQALHHYILFCINIKAVLHNKTYYFRYSDYFKFNFRNKLNYALLINLYVII